MNDHGDSFANWGYNMAQMGAAQQGGHLQGMANQAMGAIAAENASRVAQNREMRRMAHEQELERMRQETERKKANALIQRLGQQSGGFHNPAEGLYIR
jgi:uncharacterized protein YbjQ (UPF0145 family)